MQQRVPLSKPLVTDAGEITEITLRDLTAGHVVSIKDMPYVAAFDGEVVTVDNRNDVIARYVCALFRCVRR